MAKPGLYCDFDEYGIGTNGRHGGQVLMPIEVDGETHWLPGWYYFNREDQDAVVDRARVGVVQGLVTPDLWSREGSRERMSLWPRRIRESFVTML